MRLRERLSDVVRFVLRPTFRAAPMACGSEAARVWLTLFVIDALVVAGVFLPIVFWAGEAGFLPAPLERDEQPAVAIIDYLIVAPLLEELLFRGWLTGRIAALRFGLYGFAALGLMLASLLLDEDAATAISLAAVVLAFLGLLHWGRTAERDSAVPAWFARHFHWIAWGSSALFGLVHLGNFTGLENPLGVLVVLPQTIGGVLLAYTRTRLGLRAAMGHHAAFNAVFLLVDAAAS